MQAAPKQPSHCLAANPDHEVQRIAVKEETRLLGKSKGVDKNLALACYEGSDYGLPSQSPKPRPHSSLPGRDIDRGGEYHQDFGAAQYTGHGAGRPTSPG